MMKPGSWIWAALLFFSSPNSKTKVVLDSLHHRMVNHQLPVGAVDEEGNSEHSPAVDVDPLFQDVWIRKDMECDDDNTIPQHNAVVEQEKLLDTQFDHFDLELVAAISNKKTNIANTGAVVTQNHYLWRLCDFIMTTTLGVWMLMSSLNYRQNWIVHYCISAFSCKYRRNKHAESSPSPPTFFPKRSNVCYSAYSLVVWITRCSTTPFEGFCDLFSRTTGRQPQDAFFGGHCTVGHDTDDSETLLGSDIDSNDDEFVSLITRPVATTRSVPRIINHVECHRNSTTTLENELPKTSAAIEFFHAYRFNNERIE